MVHLRFAALALGTVMFGTAVFAQADKPVAMVNGLPITEQELALAAEDLTERLGQMTEDQKRDQLISYMADLKTGAKAAEDAKLGDSPEFKRRLAYYRDKVLLDEYLAREAKKAVTPEAAQKLYDETTKALKPEEEVRARHILVEEEAQAKAALARVRKGEDFAKVAIELSKDPGSGKEGGDLGFFAKDRMVAPFAEAAFGLKVGDVSEPVKTQFGWHVIKVEEKRTKPLPKFEDVKGEIEAYLVRKAQQDVILALRDKAKVERLDKPAGAPQPSAPEPKKP